MTRRHTLAVLAAAVAGGGISSKYAPAAQSASAPTAGHTLRLNARRRVPDGEYTKAVEEATYWKANQTGIIICDMWNDHYCVSSAVRVGLMIPHMNFVVRKARELGVKIVHAPSGTMDFYDGLPQRNRMIEAAFSKPPVEIGKWCYLDPKDEGPLPVDDSEEPCDDAFGRERIKVFNRQHPEIEISNEDGISDDGQQIHNYFEQNGITNVVLMGVHTNMCVLGRPFGIRQQVRLGKSVVMARDLTDAMYDPRDRPYISHEAGTQLIIEHVERYWCPSILGKDLTAAVKPVS